MSKLGRLYIAGPMRGYPNFNYEAFHAAAKLLREQSFEVVNPAENFNGDTTLPIETYMLDDFKLLLECDTVVLLEGWEKSEGASTEAVVAKMAGKATINLEHETVHVKHPLEELKVLRELVNEWKSRAFNADATVLTLTTHKPESTHWFNQHANEIHKETYAILNERAGEYADSWRSMNFPFMQSALRELGIEISVEQIRLLALGALCDTKLSRIQTGAFKPDSYIDLNNYSAAFASAVREYLNV